MTIKEQAKKTFPLEVFIEASNIKKHATKEEIDNLDFGSLDASSTKYCIYGQMTGSCHSTRSFYLIKFCAVQHFEDTNSEVPVTPDRLDSFFRTFTAIENYIYRFPQNNKLLIDYIKDQE